MRVRKKNEKKKSKSIECILGEAASGDNSSWDQFAGGRRKKENNKVYRLHVNREKRHAWRQLLMASIWDQFAGEKRKGEKEKTKNL